MRMDAFAALADPMRRDLLVRLAPGRPAWSTWRPTTRSAGPAISKHLRLLTEAGLVAAEDRGRERHYRLDRRASPGARPARALRPAPPFASGLDGLDLEVRRTGRDRAATPQPPTGGDRMSTTTATGRKEMRDGTPTSCSSASSARRSRTSGRR